MSRKSGKTWMQRQSVRAHVRYHRGRLVNVRSYRRKMPQPWEMKSDKRDQAGQKGTSLYYEPKHKHLADIIRVDSPGSARKSVRILREEHRKAKSREKKKRIELAMDVAAKRAEAAQKRQNLSAKERQEFREVAGIYQRGLATLPGKVTKVTGLTGVERQRREKPAKHYGSRSTDRGGAERLANEARARGHTDVTVVQDAQGYWYAKLGGRARTEKRVKSKTKQVYGKCSDKTQSAILKTIGSSGLGKDSVKSVYTQLVMSGQREAAGEFARKAGYNPPAEKDSVAAHQAKQLEKQKRHRQKLDENYQEYVRRTRLEKPMSRSSFHDIHVKDIMTVNEVLARELPDGGIALSPHAAQVAWKETKAKKSKTERKSKKPWEMTRSEFLGSKGAPSAGIMLDVSPAQVGMMSKRQKDRWWKKRQGEYAERGRVSDAWTKSIIDAYERGEITYDDVKHIQARGMNDDSPSSVIFRHEQRKKKAAKAKAAAEDSQMRRVHSAKEIKVGDRIRDRVSGRVGVVTKVNQKSIRMKYPGVDYLPGDHKTQMRFAEWPEGTKHDKIKKRRS